MCWSIHDYSSRTFWFFRVGSYAAAIMAKRRKSRMSGERMSLLKADLLNQIWNVIQNYFDQIPALINTIWFSKWARIVAPFRLAAMCFPTPLHFQVYFKNWRGTRIYTCQMLKWIHAMFYILSHSCILFSPHHIHWLQDMYDEMLTPQFISERRKEIRHIKGRGHARATVWTTVRLCGAHFMSTSLTMQ